MKITIKTRVANATVRIDKLGGQGVLVPGHSLLIATHCIRWDGAGGMTLGDHFIETVTTRSGTKLRVGPLAAEPVSDMAVLGALDDQEFYRESNAFEQWCDTTDAVPLTTATLLSFGDTLPVQILTHKGKWVKGEVMRIGGTGARMSIETDEQIEAGTSGGPVVDSNGKLVGIVSQASDGQPTVGTKHQHLGMIAIARLALPAWVLQRISAKRKTKFG